MFRPLALIAALAACTHPADIDPPAPDGLAERFELIAFFDEFSRDEHPLMRWEDERIDIAVDEPHRRATAEIARQLWELTGRSFQTAGHDGTVEIIVMIDTPGAMRRALDTVPSLRARSREMVRGTCGALFYPATLDQPHRIAGAIVTIDSRLNDDHIRRCIAQELTQALGLPNDIADPDGTVFASGSRRKTLSESDRNIVRILYDDRLRPGMTREEAMPIVRVIAAELEAEQQATR